MRCAGQLPAVHLCACLGLTWSFRLKECWLCKGESPRQAYQKRSSSGRYKAETCSDLIFSPNTRFYTGSHKPGLFTEPHRSL